MIHTSHKHIKRKMSVPIAKLKRFRKLFGVQFWFGLVMGYLIYFQTSIYSVDDFPEIRPELLDEIPSDLSIPLKVLNHDKLSREHYTAPSNNGSNITVKIENATQNIVRILCWVLTKPDNHAKRCLFIKKTWGKHCTKILYMSTQEDAKLSTVLLDVVESSWNLQKKSQAAWRYIYKNHMEDADWFLAAEDDSYIWMAGLQHFLAEFDHMAPTAFGHLMRNDDRLYLSRFPGYVLSKESVALYVRDGISRPNPDCDSGTWGYDEIAMGVCLKSVGVKQMDTRDSGGRLRFLPLPLHTHMSLTKSNRIHQAKYWSSYSCKPFETGWNCCSDTPIAFHEMNPKMMVLLEYFFYHLRAYGAQSVLNVTDSQLADLKSTATM